MSLNSSTLMERILRLAQRLPGLGLQGTKRVVYSSARTAQSRMIQVGSQPLNVVFQPGDGVMPPLLLINGIGANQELFTPFIDALDRVNERKLGAIRFDLPGVGASPPSLLPYRFSSLARLVAQLLDELGCPVVDVLGISWGGGLAQQFAHQYPARGRRLILVATSTGSISVPGSPQVLFKLLSPRRYFQPSYRTQFAGEIYGGRFRDDPDLMRRYARLFRAPGLRGYYWQLWAASGWTSIHWLHRIRQPTLILAGDDDPIVPLSNARLMARLIPNATLHVVSDGHLFLLTAAEQVARVVHRFLTQE